MIDKKYSYIYLTTNILNNKQYVGQHSSNNYKNFYKGSGIYILKALKKHGKDKFTKEILYNSIPCRYHLDLKEQEYIKKYNTIVPNGYNISIGGNGPKGYRHTQETKDKLSKIGKGREPWNKGIKTNNIPWNKGLKYKQLHFNREAFQTEEFKEKLRKANLGKVMSEESKRKISETLKGKIFSEETKKKMSEANKNAPNLECPFCGKIGKSRGLKRWHFDYCKENPNRLPYRERNKPVKIKCPHCSTIGGSNTMWKYHFDNCKYKNKYQ